MNPEKIPTLESEDETEQKESIPPVVNIGKRESYFNPGTFVDDKERLIIGDSIPDTERKVFQSTEASSWESGSIGFLDFYHKPDEKRLEIPYIGIEPEFQGKGFAGHLIDEVEKIASERDVSVIEIIYIDPRNTSVVKLLKKRGYKVPPELKGPKRQGYRLNFIKELDSQG